ncbi:DUF3330 domain-containing protein, partial [Pseudomonas aeruginosa]|uniref:DUF3330 domain-containing protein n=1 Tax=Pseudomonas aeruginosa TaxID=287 RepID=UPI0037482664
SPWKWRHLKSVIVPSVQSPPSMLKLHDFCNRAPDGSNPSAAIVQSASDVQCSRLLKTTDSTTTSCCVCCKEIPLDAAFTPEGAEYVEHFCGLECYQRFEARAKTGNETDADPNACDSLPSD